MPAKYLLLLALCALLWLSIYLNAVFGLARRVWGAKNTQLTTLATILRSYFSWDHVTPWQKVLLAVLVFYAGSVIAAFSLPRISFEENGPVEILQTMIVLLAGAVFLVDARKLAGFQRDMVLICATICLVVFFREVDVEDLAVPAFVKFIGAGMGRDIIFVVVFAVFGLRALRAPRQWFEAGLAHAKTLPGMLFIAGAVLMALLSLLDEMTWQRALALEEAGEVAAYLLILYSAASCVVHLSMPTKKGLQR